MNIIINENQLTRLLNKGDIEEISSDVFKRAVSKSKERGTIGRTENMGRLYFNSFIGKELMGGKIVDIVIIETGEYDNLVAIEVSDDSEGGFSPKVSHYYYDIDNDQYINMEDVTITRRDSVVFAKIAYRINNETKYRETGKHFRIKGHV